MAAGTLAAYRNDVELRIIPTLGHVRLRRLTTEKIEAAVADMLKMKPRRGSPNATYMAKTINNTLTTLAVLLGTAVSDGLLVENPCVRHGGADVRRLRIHEQYREMRYLLPEQIPVFLVSCDPHDYADPAAVLALAGLRISEAIALEPRDIDVRVGMIRVCRQIIDGTRSTLKDKTPRPIEIGRRLANQLGRRIEWCKAHRYPMLFPDPDDGDHLDRTKIRKRWHIPALIDAGLDPRLRVHDLRHTAAAAWLIAGGQSLEYVRRQLGHSSITQTQRYAHLERAGRSLGSRPDRIGDLGWVAGDAHVNPLQRSTARGAWGVGWRHDPRGDDDCIPKPRHYRGVIGLPAKFVALRPAKFRGSVLAYSSHSNRALRLVGKG